MKRFLPLLLMLLPIVALAHDTTTETSIGIGPESVPRFATMYPKASLVVPVGTTHVIEQSLDYHTIEVAGRLEFVNDPDVEIELRVVNIQVLPGGVLDMGTPDDPMQSKLTITIFDTPIDDADPFQWGNGILVMGEWFACGIPSGGWSHGPLPTNLDGVDAFKQSVQFNPQRNIVIRSENGSGTRGHTVVTGHGYADVRSVAFLDLGRTMNADLDNTTPDNVGTNQVGKYVFHWHHNHPMGETMTENGRLQDCYVDSGNVNKWGVVIHGSHFMTVTDNVVENLDGAGIVTEDGDESHNTISHNLVMGVTGSNSKGNDKQNEVLGRNNPGAAGSGIWFKGNLNNTVTDNVSIDCMVGLQAFYRTKFGNGDATYPMAPGMPNTETFKPAKALPLLIANNVSVGCNVGLETWVAPPGFAVETFYAFATADKGIFMGNGESGNIVLTDSTLMGGRLGIGSSTAYTTSVILERCELSHFTRSGLIGAQTMRLTECKLSDNALDIDVEAIGRDTNTCDIIDSELLSEQTVRMKNANAPGGPRSPSVFDWVRKTPGVHVVNGVEEYWLVDPSHEGSQQAPVAAYSNYGSFFCPPSPGTIYEGFERYGIVHRGWVGDYASAKDLPGLVNCRAIYELNKLAQPRVIVCLPNAYEKVESGLDKLTIYWNVSGEELQEGDVAFVQIDGVDVPTAANNIKLGRDRSNITIKTMPAALTEGQHLIESWIERNGQVVPGSGFSGGYTVGDALPPPPDPDPEPEPPSIEEQLADLQARIAELERILAELLKLLGK